MSYDHDVVRFVDQYTERQVTETPQDRLLKTKTMAEADKAYAAMPQLPEWGWPKDQNTKSLDAFFTPEMLGRVIFSPKTPDLTDDWGMFGTYPSFIIVKGLNYKGVRCIADEAWLCGTSLKHDPDLPIPTISDFSYFPKLKLDWNMAGGGHHDAVYKYLSERLHLPANGQALRPDAVDRASMRALDCQT